LIFAVPSHLLAYMGEKLAKGAKVSIDEARAIALKAQPGTISWRNLRGAEDMLHIIGTIIIGFVAGVIAKLVTPGDKEPQGFILTTILGIVGAFVATYLGQAIGWYGPNQNAGFIGAIVGAVLILLVWGFIDRRRQA
jgi:uncharacterized membrane protein YeaQ/YmgE (transglycosylase-associated protein family)